VDIQSYFHRLSLNQLRALRLLAKTKKGLADSVVLGKQLGISGKALGGLFSSISRQKIKGQRLVFAWGRSEKGRGLRWRLNQEVVSKRKLLKITEEVLSYD